MGEMKTRAPATTSQTVGPYFGIGLAWLYSDSLAGPDTPGERVEIRGRIVDGDGNGVPDALLEVWQADTQGHYPRGEGQGVRASGRGFQGFGRIPTAEGGSFRFTTIKPGRVPGPDGKMQAPHIVVAVFMRGLLRRLVTRIYFPEEAANAEDFALSLVELPRRRTLVARKAAEHANVLEWNVTLQGPDETVFFDC